MARSLVVNIVGDSSSLDRALLKASKSATRFDRKMSQTFRGTAAGSGVFRSLGRSVAFASAGFLGAAGLTALIKTAFDEMSNAQKVSAQTATVLESTGGVAGVSARHVDTLATSLLNLSGVDDEAIKSSENLLLTFTNIRNVLGKGNDVFDQATKAALDLSIRFDKDLASSAVLVGKALQDPIRGLTALQRVGVQFSAGQRKQIKALVESGKVLEAQKLILGELRRQTEGAAAAYGQTLAGKLNIAKQSLINMGGAIATALLPSLTKAADQLARWLKNPKNQKKVIDDLTGAIRNMGAAIQFVSDTIDKGRQLGDWLDRHHLHFLNESLIDLIKPNLGAPGLKPGERPPGLRGPTGGRRRPGAVAPGAAERLAAARAAAKALVDARKARQARVRQANEAARQEVLDRAEFAVEKTTATKTLKDDLAALRRYNQLLTKRIKGGHGTLELEREQFRVQQQIADVLKQQADLAKKTRKRLGVDVTRFQKSARGQLVAVGGGGRVIHIANMTIHGVQNVGALENELARRSKQRAHQRRHR